MPVTDKMADAACRILADLAPLPEQDRTAVMATVIAQIIAASTTETRALVAVRVLAEAAIHGAAGARRVPQPPFDPNLT